MHDPLGAFLPGPRKELAPLAPGPLNGMTFAIKDIFDTQGDVTGCGNPDWARTHEPAKAHAWAVRALLEAGGRSIGKTITDELAYSLNGQNFHFGTPANPNAPGRIPGGSSSGSVAAVAGGLCDTALGSDTGGSVRLPASYCGVYGLRPTHGRVPLEGVMPLAPSYDVVGWFARDAGTLNRVGAVLLGEDAQPQSFERLVIARDAFQQTEAGVAAALEPWVKRLEARLGRAEEVSLYEPFDPETLMWHFRHIQADEVWGTHGPWIEENKPLFGPEIQERFDWLLTVPQEKIDEAKAVRQELRKCHDALLQPGTLMVLPASPGIAPSLDASPEALRHHRGKIIALTGITPLNGLPQISLPLAELEGCPLGLSLMAPRGSDRALLDFVESWTDSFAG